MPSMDPTIQEKGFRTSMLGFDKNDVLAYMNALANETQQRELEYQQTIDQLNAQLEKLKKDQSNARICVEKLQAELNQANARADAAEKAQADAAARLKDADERAGGYQAKCKEYQQSILELQFQRRDLEKQVEEMEAMIPKGGMPAPVPETPKPAPAPVPETPAPAPAPMPVTEQARIEARKILAEARLNAESAERRLRAKEEEQKERMADNARALAAGVMLLRDRLARVDQKLIAASMDLENATGAIYHALDDTSADLETLGADLRAFGKLRPVDQTPAPPTSAKPKAAPARAKVSPRRVRPVDPQPAVPAKRLRRTPADQPVTRQLDEALHRLDRKP